MVKGVLLCMAGLLSVGFLSNHLNPQDEKDKIKAVRSGSCGVSLLHAVRAFCQMHGGTHGSVNAELPNMDFKVECRETSWRFDPTSSGVLGKGAVLRSDQMGNYMAGYAAGYSDYPWILYACVRIGGIRSANIANNEGWLDQESVPDIWNGFVDGYNDFTRDHPVRHLLRRVVY